MDLPRWNLSEVALIVVYPTDELAFLQANPTAVHPSLTPYNTWESGINWDNELLTNTHSSAKSQTETDVPGAHPAVLLLRQLPKNGGAYIFGRGSRHIMPDVVLPDTLASRRHFCVYPNLPHRTWVIQDLSGRGVTVNDCQVNSKQEDQGETSHRRALQYDRLNRVHFSNTAHHPGSILYIKPVWPEDSRYLRWGWQNPQIPELAGLNLSWTLTSATPTQSQQSQLPGSSTPAKFCVLERRLCDDVEVFYGQDLETGAMFAAEKLSSEREAREQLIWRKHLRIEHLLKASDFCLLDHPYILAVCPFDTLPLADAIQYEPLDDRARYALLQEVLRTLDEIYKKGIANVTITWSNVLVARLSPDKPLFWLTGISSARVMSEDTIKETHSTDVYTAMRTIGRTHGGADYFEDPAANAILTGFLQSLPSTPLSARDILDGFQTLTHGLADFPFKSSYLEKEFSAEQFRFGDQAYYRKTELALIAQALFGQTAKKSQQAYTRILSTKPSEKLPGHEGEQLLNWQDASTLFRRLGSTLGIRFWPALELEREKKREREGVGRSTRAFPIRIQITNHAPSQMWNLSQLTNAVRPTDSLEIGDPDHCVEVGGDAECEGLYVDLSTFGHACRLLYVSPPPESPQSDLEPNPRGDLFQSVNSHEGDLVLVDKKLLGTAIFKRSSRTMHYGGTDYSEASAMQRFSQDIFDDLHRGISQSRRPAPTLKELCQGQPAQNFSESQCQSLTESQSGELLPSTRRQLRRRNQRQGQPEKLTEDWVNEQSKRRRHIRADIKRHELVDGHLQPVDDGDEEAANSSTSESA